MNRFERWAVWSTTIGVLITGIGFGWTKYLLPASDPFSVIQHPLQPVFLKLHILVAPLFLFAIGGVAVHHIWQHLRSGTRRSRKSGITAAVSLAPMVATGYLIQVLTGEGWLKAMIVAHIAFGLLFLVGIGLHQWLLARAAEPRRRRVLSHSGRVSNGRASRRPAAPHTPPNRADSRRSPILTPSIESDR